MAASENKKNNKKDFKQIKALFYLQFPKLIQRS